MKIDDVKMGTNSEYAGKYIETNENKSVNASELPTKFGMWSKVKSFLFQEIDLKKDITLELTPKEEKVLTEGQVKEIFPDAEILLISHFVDNKTTVRKQAFEKKDFLLLNDTDKYFYKYSFRPQSVKYSPVAGLFKASSIGKITFSHFGQDKYTIYVKNNFRKQK